VLAPRSRYDEVVDTLAAFACRTGLDHISFGVAACADLDAWAAWLDGLGIEHSGVIDTDNPIPYSVVVFRDPDHLQLALFYMAAYRTAGSGSGSG
jgi:hypothetical protein